MTSLVTRATLRLHPDPSRVLARLFVPANGLVLDRESRSSGLLSRILALTEEEVLASIDGVLARFAGRHRDLRALLLAHYTWVSYRVTAGMGVSEERKLLIGACFTNEYSVEGAALFNPSAVPHPDQSGLAPGQTRFVLSLRAVGEGHLSSIELRTGVVGPGDQVRVDEPAGFLDAGRHGPATQDRDLFRSMLADAGADGESASYLLGRLPARFAAADLEGALAGLAELAEHGVSRHGTRTTDALARRIAACSYEVDFPADTAMDERILWPYAPSESGGMEDARFVRFTADDGTVTYLATYTAYDGTHVAPQLIETTDFAHFRVGQLTGPAARNKGMALFPRPVGGRRLALSRWDRESSSIVSSPDGWSWGGSTTLQTPDRPWELVQLGNAGSPIETESGWLVLTHGVGPMREYTLGALLLDLEDPSVVLGELREPFLRPQPDERDGYVPNVVYSCGALACGDRLLLPYGISDAAVGFAFVDLPGLLDRLVADGPPAGAEQTRAKSSA